MSESCWNLKVDGLTACLSIPVWDDTWEMSRDEQSEVGGPGARAPASPVFDAMRKQVCSGATSSAECTSDPSSRRRCHFSQVLKEDNKNTTREFENRETWLQ